MFRTKKNNFLVASMATRSIVAELRRVKLQLEVDNRLWRSFYSHGSRSNGAVDGASREFIRTKTKNDLGREILKLKHPRDSATIVLRSWADTGYEVSFPELRRFSVKLLKLRRFNHALQIMDWLESRRRFQMSPADHAIKMDLIIKAKGPMEAEDYFQNLSGTASRKAACFPLLRGYVERRDTEKAEAFMAKLNELGLILSPHLCNLMMKLYMATSQFGEVLLVIKEMKRNRIPLNVLSYNLWMNACAEISGVESVEMVYAEMTIDGDVEIGWSSLCTLANVYVKAGKFESASLVLKSAELKLSSCNRLGYFFLITQHASLKNKDEILRLWEASKAVGGRITCSNYMCVLSCLVKLGDLVEAERVFREWESNRSKYDVRVSNVLLGAYVRNGMMEKAEALHLHAMERGGCPNYKTWEILIEGWVKSQEMEKAIGAMKKAFYMLRDCHWRPSDGIVMTIAKYLEKNGDVEGALWYVTTIHDLGFASLSLYKMLLRMHLSSHKPAFDILKMIEMDKIEMDDEAHALVRAFKE